MYSRLQTQLAICPASLHKWLTLLLLMPCLCLEACHSDATSQSVSITVSPTSATLAAGATQQFTATIIGSTNAAVNWSVSSGSISSSGLYTAPVSIMANTTVTLTATAQADSTKQATATLTVTPVVSVAVSPTSVSLAGGGQRQFTATVYGTTNSAVTWSVSGGGSITSAGLYSAPASVTSSASATVTATSQADTTKTGSATVTLTPPGSASPSVKVYLTTPDQTNLVTQQSSISFSITGTGSSSNQITVDEGTTYQTVIGFGANYSDLTTYLMTNYMNATQRTALMQKLFDPSTGTISVVRIAIGANDQVYTNSYNNSASTYDDNGGTADYSLTNFSIAHDTAYIIPRIQDALAVNPDLKILGSAWWQPSWLVVTDSTTCGTGNGKPYLTVDPTHYSTYANLFVKYIQAYAAHQIPIWAVEPQNEPQCGGQTQQNIELPAASQNSFIKNYLYPAFQSNSITTAIIPNVDQYCDNTNVHTSYVNTILSDTTTLSEILGPSWHGYCSPSSASFITTTHNSYPSSGAFETEVGYNAPYSWSNLTAQGGGSADIIAVMRNWGQVFLFHAMANSTAGTLGTCDAEWCGPIFEIDTSNGNVFYLMSFYVLEHFGSFVRPGAYRIDSNEVRFNSGCGLQELGWFARAGGCQYGQRKRANDQCPVE